jgi:hypothetical protein
MGSHTFLQAGVRQHPPISASLIAGIIIIIHHAKLKFLFVLMFVVVFLWPPGIGPKAPRDKFRLISLKDNILPACDSSLFWLLSSPNSSTLSDRDMERRMGMIMVRKMT